VIRMAQLENSCSGFVGEGCGISKGKRMMMVLDQQLFGCLPCSLPADPVAQGTLTSTADGQTSAVVSRVVTRSDCL